MAIKLAGGAYLSFLGIKLILEQRRQFYVPVSFRRSTGAAAFRQGVLTNVLNPKVALFFLAFLPQFIDPASSHKIAAFIVLGLTFVTTGTTWCLVLAWCAAGLCEHLRQNETIGLWINRTVGSLFVFLGVRLATTR
jgi:threonine/homoserine/homoserine lactone efflux protein